MTELRVHLLPECLINPPPVPREGPATRGLGGALLGGVAGEAPGAISKRILPAAEMKVRKAQQAYDAADPDKKHALEIALEIAKRKLAWQTRLREAAGLEPPHPQ